MNKSMLNMLNNEIQCLHTEKEELEKKLLNPSSKRAKTPCVAIQEEDEEEEANNATSSLNNESDGGNHRLETIEEYTPNYEAESSSSPYSGKLITKDSELNELINFNEKIQRLQKQVEEMTFYADELKSDLEAEREKNNECSNEIDSYRKQLESVEVKTTTAEKDSTAPSSNMDCESSRSNSSEEILKYHKELSQKNDFKSIKQFLEEHSESDVIKEMNAVISKITDLFEADIKTKEASLREETEQKKYFESQLEKVIANFKEEIDSLEAQLKEKTKEFDDLTEHVSSCFFCWYIDLNEL